jgi:hypothetical protein
MGLDMLKTAVAGVVLGMTNDPQIALAARSLATSGTNAVKAPEPTSADGKAGGVFALIAVTVTPIALGVVARLGGAAAGVEGIALKEGEAAASGMHAHHIFPQELAPEFERGGINIEEFRVQLSEGTHLGQLHGTGGIPGVGPGGLWNETWRQYMAGEAAAGRALTPQGLLEQAAQMLGDFNVPYYSPVPGL